MATDEVTQTDEQGAGAGDQPAGTNSSLIDSITGALQDAGREGAVALVDQLVDAIFSPQLRERIEVEANDGFRDLLDGIADALPESAAGQELERQLNRARRQLQVLLQQMLDALFTGVVRSDFRERIGAAAATLVDGNPAEARRQIELALQALLESVMHVVQEHWGQVLRLVLRLVAKALQEALVAQVKEGMQNITNAPREAMQEKVETLQEQMEEKTEDLRERLIEARDTMQQRLEEARANVQERIGGAGGVSGGSRPGTRQLGRPPSTRPPGGPAGRPPNRKPPSGRPPSLTRSR